MCLALCLSLIPAGLRVKAADETIIIKISATIKKPESGKTFDYAPTITTNIENGASVRVYDWYRIAKANYTGNIYEDEWETIDDYNYTAEEGYYYRVSLVAETKSTYSFRGQVTCSVNGSTGKVVEFSNPSRVDFDAIFSPLEDGAEVKCTEVTDFTATITAPKLGEKIDFKFVCSTNPDGAISEAVVMWYKQKEDDHNDNSAWFVPVVEGDIAEEGFYYEAAITISLKDIFTVSKTATYTINDREPDAWEAVSGSICAFCIYFDPLKSTDGGDTGSTVIDGDDNGSTVIDGDDNGSTIIDGDDTGNTVIDGDDTGSTSSEDDDNNAPLGGGDVFNNIPVDDGDNNNDAPAYVPVVLPAAEPEVNVNDNETPAAAPETPAEDKADETPAETEGATETEAADPEVTEIEVVETEVPEALPKTGTLAVGLFYGIGAACLAAGGTLLRRGKRKED